MTLHNSPWIVYPRPNPEARLRLFCIPYAGGGASLFRDWPDYLPPEIEVCSIQLPGRENRIKELPEHTLARIVEELLPLLCPLIEKPFALFGYSMGALISFEIARSLQNYYSLVPTQLLVAANQAPHIPHTNPLLHDLPSQLFLEEIRQLNGTPEDFFNEPELVQLLLPTLRADFAIWETYQYTPYLKLTCPITAFVGFQEIAASKQGFYAWQQETQGAFSLQIVDGGHFFIHTAKRWLLARISEALQLCSF